MNRLRTVFFFTSSHDIDLMPSQYSGLTEWLIPYCKSDEGYLQSDERPGDYLSIFCIPLEMSTWYLCFVDETWAVRKLTRTKCIDWGQDVSMHVFIGASLNLVIKEDCGDYFLFV